MTSRSGIEEQVGHILRESFGPDFLTGARGKRSVFVTGEPDRFAGLITWQQVSDFLTSRVADERVVVTKQGTHVPRQDYARHIPGTLDRPPEDRVDPVRLQAILRAGGTLRVDDGVAFPSIYRACRSFERWFRAPTRASVFISYSAGRAPGDWATPTHWDAHDAFLFQIAGSKFWQVFAPERPHPLNRDVEFADRHPAVPTREGILRPGDALYIPRGWWHRAQSTGGKGVLSLHVTFGVAPVTGIDLLAWLADQLRSVDIFRADLPRFSSSADRRDHVRELWREIGSRWHDDLLDEFLSFQDGATRPTGWCSLPWSVDGSLPNGEGFALVSASPRRIEPRLAAGDLVVEALGRRWRLDPVVTPFLEHVADGHLVRFDELPKFVTDALGLEELRELISTLVADGLLAVIEV